MSEAYEKDQVVKIINSVIEKVGRSEEEPAEAIFKELSDLKKIIDDTRRDIGAARACDITGTHIPTATDELDAVIDATAEATGSIMDACEAIEEKASSIEGGSEISAEVTKIYEACSFQDITGQRITKVVGALRDIEIKVNALLSILGQHDDDAPIQSDKVDDDGLLNGPQLAGGGITQDDIDKLLEDFD